MQVEIFLFILLVIVNLLRILLRILLRTLLRTLFNPGKDAAVPVIYKGSVVES